MPSLLSAKRPTREVMEAISSFARKTNEPLGVAAGVAWLESAWNPSNRTGSHYGLYQVKKAVYDDWRRVVGQPVAGSVSWDMVKNNPLWNAQVAAWAWNAVKRRIGDLPGQTPRQKAIATYWSWLVGTFDGPKVVKQAWMMGAKRPREWRLMDPRDLTGLKKKFWQSAKKAGYAEKLSPWYGLTNWPAVIAKAFSLRRGRTAVAPVAAAGTGGGVWLWLLLALLLAAK